MKITYNFFPAFVKAGYSLLPCRPSQGSIFGQTDHTAKTVWVSDSWDYAVLTHELVHCLQRRHNLAWFALQEFDGYYGTSIRGGECPSFNEWQAHSVEGFLRELHKLNRMARELQHQPSWYRCSELDNLPYTLIGVEDWISTFVELAFNATDEELLEWVAQYGFTTSREVN